MAVTADKVVVEMQAKVDGWMRDIGRMQADFAKKMKQVGDDAVKAGNATSVAFDQAAGAFIKAGKGLEQTGKGLKSTGNGARMAQMQMRNLAFQFQDIGTMMAAGQSPFMLLAQQLPQVTMYGGSMNGVMGALRGTVASLISPLGLATTAFVLLGSSAISYFTSAKESAEEVNEFLEAQRKRIDDLVEGYDRAGEAAQRYRKNADARPADEVQFDIGQERSSTVDRYNASIASMRDNIRQLQEYVLVYARGTEFEKTALQQAKALEEIQRAADATEPDLDAIILQLKQFRENDPYDVLDDIAKGMLEDAEAARKFAAAIGEIDASAQHINAAEEAFRNLRSAVDEIDSSKARKEVDDLVSKFEEGEISIEELTDALDLLKSFNLDLSDQINEVIALGTAADQARNKLSKLDPNIDPARFGYADLPESGPRPTPRPNDFTVEDILDEQRRAAERAARSAEKKRAKQYEQLAKRIADAAAATVVETEAQRQLNPLIDDYGYAVERARIQQDLLNAAKEQGKEVTPALRNEIDQLAHQYATATVEAAKLAEEQDKIREKAEELAEFNKDLARGIIDGFIEGKNAADIFADALKKVGDRLINDVLDNIFKIQNAGGGGGFFGFISNILGFGGGISSTAMSAVNAGAGGLYDKGGYTGPGGKYQPAGVVHKGEYVFSKAAVDKIGVGNLEAMHRNLKGYAEGGFVAPSAPPMRMASQAPGSVYAPQYNIDASGAEAGVETKISAALKEYDKGNYQRFLSNMGNARKRNAI